MTPEEYERRPEVKAALKLVRSHRELVAGAGWANFKIRLMAILGIPPSQYYTWDVPTEFKYASKRVKAGWSRKDAFRQVVASDIKGRLSGADDPLEALETALMEEFSRLPYARYNGWSFSFEYPGFFVYVHDNGKRVYFTPNWDRTGVVSIQIHDARSEDPTGYAEAPFTSMRAEELFDIVRPYLTPRPHGGGRKAWDPRAPR